MELTDKIVKEKHLTTIMVTHNLRYAVEYGNRLLMMHQGGIVMDLKGEEKAHLEVEQILDKFNEIVLNVATRSFIKKVTFYKNKKTGTAEQICCSRLFRIAFLYCDNRKGFFRTVKVIRPSLRKNGY